VHFRKVLVQWHIPYGDPKDGHDLYANWDTKVNFRWTIDHTAEQADYVSTDSIIALWKPKKKEANSFWAPRKQIKFAVDHLHRIAEEEEAFRTELA